MRMARGVIVNPNVPAATARGIHGELWLHFSGKKKKPNKKKTVLAASSFRQSAVSGHDIIIRKAALRQVSVTRI
jgi:hypothetical protein